MNWLLHLPLLLKFAVFGTAVLILAVFMARPTIIDWFGVMKLQKPKNNGNIPQTEPGETTHRSVTSDLRDAKDNPRNASTEVNEQVKKGAVLRMAQ